MMQIGRVEIISLIANLLPQIMRSFFLTVFLFSILTSFADNCRQCCGPGSKDRLGKVLLICRKRSNCGAVMLTDMGDGKGYSPGLGPLVTMVG